MSDEPKAPPKPPTPEQAAQMLEQQAQHITDSDLETVLSKEARIRDMAASGPLRRMLEDLRTMLSLLRDYTNGAYREIPWFSIAAVAAALLYVLNPLDLVPDALPIVGHLDDAAVAAACLAMLREDIARYRAWKANERPAQ